MDWKNSNKSFVFTIFDMNFEPKVLGEWEKCEYFVCCKEPCPTTGRPHFQCYFRFKTAARGTALHKRTGIKFHMEPSLDKNKVRARTYCMKHCKGCWNGEPCDKDVIIDGPWEFGEWRDTYHRKKIVPMPPEEFMEQYVKKCNMPWHDSMSDSSSASREPWPLRASESTSSYAEAIKLPWE